MSSLMSATSSVASSGSGRPGAGEPLPPNKYLMKTLCFSKKSLQMPNKEDYAMLLRCGLGARKWQVGLDMDAETFRHALLNIYPRLGSASGFTLWTLNKDKAFEKLPQKVNTPCRFKAYLGTQFTGCLIIMPTEEISLGPSPKDNHVEVEAQLRQEQRQQQQAVSGKKGPTVAAGGGHKASARDRGGSKVIVQDHHQHHQAANGAAPVQQPHHAMRQFCLVCGRMAKQQQQSLNVPPPTEATFYDIGSTLANCGGPGAPDPASSPPVTIGRRLSDVLRVELPKRKLVPSEQICKKCFRQISEIDYLEAQLKAAKDDMVNNFFGTVSKISRIDPAALVMHVPPPMAVPPSPAPSTASSSSLSSATAVSALQQSKQRPTSLQQRRSSVVNDEDERRHIAAQPHHHHQYLSRHQYHHHHHHQNGHHHHQHHYSGSSAEPSHIHSSGSGSESSSVALASAASSYSSYRAAEVGQPQRVYLSSSPYDHPAQSSSGSSSSSSQFVSRALDLAAARYTYHMAEEAARRKRQSESEAGETAQDLVTSDRKRRREEEEEDAAVNGSSGRRPPSSLYNSAFEGRSSCSGGSGDSSNNSGSPNSTSSPPPPPEDAAPATVVVKKEEPEEEQREHKTRFPLPPWKKRYRKVEEDKGERPNARKESSKIELGSRDVRSNLDSGLAGSDDLADSSESSESSERSPTRPSAAPEEKPQLRTAVV